MQEKQLLRSNRDMLTLVDRELARVREHSASLAVLTDDPDSFQPYMLCFVGTDGDPGILPVNSGGSDAAYGNAQIDSDAAFVATGWQAFRRSSTNYVQPPLYTQSNLLLDVRLTDMTAGRNLTRGEGPPDLLGGNRFSTHYAMSPIVPIVSPFTLPRNTSLQISMRQRQTFLAQSQRIYFILHGFKIFGD